MQTLHDFGATFQFGVVAAVDDAKHRLRVSFPALENMPSDWLPMLTLAAGGNQFYSLPDEGELVACLLDARGENGVVLGAIYNEQDPTPAASRDVWVKQFSNGTVIRHERGSGNVTVKTSGTVSIDAPETVVSGTLLVEGILTYQSGLNGSSSGGAAATINGDVQVSGDVVADGISLRGHRHQGDSGGTTGEPL